MSYSIVEFRGQKQGYACGYCHSVSTKCSSGMWAHSLTVQDYQDLIDRGWRRSGKYVYKPTMNETCCPQYPIRCDPALFKPSKSQRKVIKRANKYFNTGAKPGKYDNISSETDAMALQDGGAELIPNEARLSRNDAIAANIDLEKFQDLLEPAKPDLSKKKCLPKEINEVESQPKSSCDASTSDNSDIGQKSQKKPPKPGLGADLTKPQCKKAKLLRLERKAEKHSAAQKQVSKPSEVHVKGLQDLLDEINSDSTHKIEVRLVRSHPRSELFKQSFLESHAVYKRYQMVIHNDPPDKPTEKQFTRFLVDSPLDSMEQVQSKKAGSQGFGSFHQQYLLDGKIIAVGVLDILPQGVSSVYLYYDPDYAFLSLGTYSALREVAFTSYMHSVEPSILNYYMGFYIHSCPKMKYKGLFKPSYLLCPETYGWFPLEICGPKLDAKNYSRFDETDKGDGEAVSEGGLQGVLCLHQRQAMPYFIYHAMNPEVNDSDEVLQYANLIGATCSQRMLLYRATRSIGDDDSD